MRPIDADELKKQIESGDIVIDEDVLKCENIDDVLVYLLGKVERFVVETIDAQPTINPEDLRPKGKWITPTIIGGKSLSVPHCSVCNEVPCGVDENTKFCPNCGAKMEG